MEAARDDAARLRAAGMRGTSARLAILEPRVGESRYHIVCRRCGAVADVARVAGRAPCLDPSAAAGYVIEKADVTFWGLCARCRSSR